MVVDDESGLLRFMRTMLEAESHQVEVADSGETALQKLSSGGTPDVVLLDMVMPGMDGLSTLSEIKRLSREQKVVMLSCVTDSRKIAEAVRLGAHDYLTKPVDKASLDQVLRGLRVAPGEDPVSTIDELDRNQFMLAACPQMLNARTQAALVAKTDIPVLLLGESGTGKEIMARYIHGMSARSKRTFMKVNCAALPADLLESELFGYEAGAFTGATKAKPGKFELCNHGTILLDEIGEIPPLLQAKLLHVLQDKQFSRLGGRAVVNVDVRVLAATNIDIPASLASGKLRQDLFYRLDGFSITLPPLRARKQEIPLLLKHFMARYAERSACAPLPITQTLVEACLQHEWPGNLRELENFVKRYLVLRDEQIAIEELRSHSSLQNRQNGTRTIGSQSNDLKDLVKSNMFAADAAAISRAVELPSCTLKEAAMYLNISYKALLYKIRQYQLHPPTRQARIHVS
jgi:two-component system response regulator AtoC